MEVFMIVMICVFAVILIMLSVYLLIFYSHPDDTSSGTGIACKIVVVLGMILSWLQVLLLPLDVANNRGYGGDIPMNILWQVTYISLGAFIVFIIPTFIYYYEADEEWTCGEKMKYSFIYLFVMMITISGVTALAYFFLGFSEVPVITSRCTIQELTATNVAIQVEKFCVHKYEQLELRLRFDIFAIGLFSFCSWFLFVLFGGIGIMALPIDFIYYFCKKPVKVTKEELQQTKNDLINDIEKVRTMAKEAQILEQRGVKTQFAFSKEKREYNGILTKLRASSNIIDDQYKLIEMQETKNDEWVLSYYISLVVGILCLIISLTWITHILLFVIIRVGTPPKPIYSFLNILLLYFQNMGLGFLSSAIFSIFCLYLLWATIKGNLKFGVRVMCCFDTHPMKKDETYMNSFLFNILLIMLCSISVTQFCAGAFEDYISFTDINIIFVTQIKYIKLMRYVFEYRVFEYALCAVIVLSTVYLIIRPSDVEAVKNTINKESASVDDTKVGLTDHDGDKSIN